MCAQTECVLCWVQYTAVPQQTGAPLRTVTVKDAIGDLPPITNGADTEEMPYPGGHLNLQRRQRCCLLPNISEHVSQAKD